MRIKIRTQDMSLTRGMEQLVYTRIHSALGRLSRRVNEVILSFEDVNGPRGGEDIHCRIRLFVQPRGEVYVSAIAATPGAALSKAVQRAERRLNSRIQRHRTRRRWSREPSSQITAI